MHRELVAYMLDIDTHLILLRLYWRLYFISYAERFMSYDTPLHG
jgi:hypothetical protein